MAEALGRIMEILGFIVEVEECLRPTRHPCFDLRATALWQLPRRTNQQKKEEGQLKKTARNVSGTYRQLSPSFRTGPEWKTTISSKRQQLPPPSLRNVDHSVSPNRDQTNDPFNCFDRSSTHNFKVPWQLLWSLVAWLQLFLTGERN